MLLKFPPDHPPFAPGSKLPKMPDLTYHPHPPTDAEAALLEMLRPYYDQPDTLFNLLDALMSYYVDELPA